MGTKLLHIGLNKCGSTFLQREIFPEIEKKTKIKIIQKNEIHDATKTKFHPLENKKDFYKSLPESFIISFEAFFSQSCEFSLIHKSFDYIKQNFSKDTTILLVIRNPYDYLNSSYVQSVASAIDLRKPEEFFYVENNNDQRKNGKYNLYNFDYKFLISLYKSYFKKVLVVKYEDINELSFLKKIFDIDDIFIEKLKKKKSKTHNKSISKTSVNIVMFLNRFIDLNKYQRFFTTYTKPEDHKLKRIFNKILSLFLLRVFLQEIIDKILPYKKYKINKKFIPINIDKLEEDYKNLKP